MGTILVTDGEQRAALAVVRSLGRAGHTVYVCSTRARSLAGASRYAAGAAALPDPLARPADFVAEVERLVERRRIDMLIPVADASVLALLPQRDRFPGVSIPYPPYEAYRRISDKALLLGAARTLGLAVPACHILPEPGTWVGLVPAGAHFPIVIKPSRSIADGAEGRTFGVRYARDPAELEARLAEFPRAAYPLLLQQRVVGPGIGVFLLLWRGEPLAVFCHRRLREKPPSGGVSVYRESVPPDPELVGRSRTLLEYFGWEGVAMVEYKLDAATGTPYLMEVNGRFWGSLQLAVDAGVDFPAILAAAGYGEPPAPTRGYRAGVRSRWWWGDVDHLLARLRATDDLALPPDAPSRGRAILEFLRVLRAGDTPEVLKLHDPRPFLRETLDWLARR